MSQKYTTATFEGLGAVDEATLLVMLYLAHLADEDGVASALVSAVASGARAAPSIAQDVIAEQHTARNLFHLSQSGREVYVLMLGRPARDHEGRGPQQQLRAILIERFEMTDEMADAAISEWRKPKGDA